MPTGEESRRNGVKLKIKVKEVSKTQFQNQCSYKRKTRNIINTHNKVLMSKDNSDQSAQSLNGLCTNQWKVKTLQGNEQVISNHYVWVKFSCFTFSIYKIIKYF